ncbi:MAG TPA: glycogen debranching enzyme GlgX, partial [Granulicella sp.]|nr:glycogen debranching enzyme GlgX [Granulicella sp.]
MQRKLLPGRPYPLGAKANPRGTNFAVYSEHGTQVEVCLFDDAGQQTDCITLRERTAFVWHGLVLGVQPGQQYGFRVDGPWDPAKGLRFNRNKLLVDPYTEAISGQLDWKAPIFGHDRNDDLKRCELD